MKLRHKTKPISPTNGATRCVADAAPMLNNPDYGASHPCNSLWQHCDAAGDLRFNFLRLEKAVRVRPDFSTVSDVPSRPCSPDVQHHPGHRTRSGRLNSFLTITGRDFWAIVGRRFVPALQNVAKRHYHPHLTTHPKLVRILFRGPCAPSVAPNRRRCAHVYVSRALEWRVAASLCDSSSKRLPKSRA